MTTAPDALLLPLDASQILAIPLTEPERLFRSPTQLKAVYRALVKFWHPDHSRDPKATEVISHITILHAMAERKIAAGVWETPGKLELRGKDAKTRYVSFERSRATDLPGGRAVYGRTVAAWLFPTAYADLFETARRTISGLTYRDATVRNKTAPLMPKLLKTFETTNGFCAMVQQKTEDVFLLADLLEQQGGRIDPKHVAWIVSSTLNLACYLESIRMTHNALTIDNLFVSPQHHSVLLLGGWWYSAGIGSQLSALPAATRAIAPPDILKAKRADPRIDLISIRALGRELLGDRTGMTLLGRADIPKPMLNFLRFPPAQRSALVDYSTWMYDVLPAAFGARRFVPLEIPLNQIYPGQLANAFGHNPKGT